jgi:pyrroline-5-carboxylate reductase
MTVGFLGTGHITAAMVTGLGASDDRIWLSPRNAEIAADLARRFSHVTVAASNQDVLDQSDVIILALPPNTAFGIIATLRFRENHQIISVISGFPTKDIAARVAPATRITRAVPLPSVAERAGPTAIYPPNSAAAALFDSLGTTVPVENEAQFESFCTVTASIASYLAFSDAVASWLNRQGVPDTTAVDYTRAMFRGVINGKAGAQQHATPGGINEQLLRHLERAGVFERLGEGLDVVRRSVLERRVRDSVRPRADGESQE